MSNFIIGDSLVPLYLGDGSLNLTANSYNSKVYIDNKPFVVPNWTRNGSINQMPSQYLPATYIEHTPRGTQTYSAFFAGTNTYTFSAANPIIGRNRVVSVVLQWAYLTGNVTFNSFQVRLNGTLTTLSNAVTNNLIRPWVGTCTWYPAAGQPYVSSTSVNFYNGGSVQAIYSFADIAFILNSGTTMDAISFNSSVNSYTGNNFADGWRVYSYSYSDYPITITR
jgi:hypothetical protein